MNEKKNFLEELYVCAKMHYSVIDLRTQEYNSAWSELLRDKTHNFEWIASEKQRIVTERKAFMEKEKKQMDEDFAKIFADEKKRIAEESVAVQPTSEQLAGLEAFKRMRPSQKELDVYAETIKGCYILQRTLKEYADGAGLVYEFCPLDKALMKVDEFEHRFAQLSSYTGETYRDRFGFENYVAGSGLPYCAQLLFRDVHTLQEAYDEKLFKPDVKETPLERLKNLEKRYPEKTDEIEAFIEVNQEILGNEADLFNESVDNFIRKTAERAINGRLARINGGE